MTGKIGFSNVDCTYYDGAVWYKLTDDGIKNIERYIAELKAKRKEVLDAGLDTADETEIPLVSDIFIDAMGFGIDDDGTVYDGWGVTDNYDADSPICLELGKDFVVIE